MERLEPDKMFDQITSHLKKRVLALDRDGFKF